MKFFYGIFFQILFFSIDVLFCAMQGIEYTVALNNADCAHERDTATESHPQVYKSLS